MNTSIEATILSLFWKYIAQIDTTVMYDIYSKYTPSQQATESSGP